jgi:hypothetical protein
MIAIGENKTLLENTEVYPIDLKLIPQGWLHQNISIYAQLFQDFVVSRYDVRQRIIFKDKNEAYSETLEGRITKFPFPFNHFASMAFPNVSKALGTIARYQAGIDLAAIVCRLEIYKIDHGVYPDALESLAPDFLESLPTDLLTGEPYHYQLQNDGKFLLYAVGWNENDDNGDIKRDVVWGNKAVEQQP